MTELKETLKATRCKHCDVSYPTTKEYFYTSYGKLKLNMCKECKKAQSRKYEKNRDRKGRVQVRDKEKKKAYNKMYRERKKAEKEKLKNA